MSANGTSNGIVWAAELIDPGILHAHDATNLASELYKSSQATNGRDAYGAGQKYLPSTVAGGKVFTVGED